jgi:hypothetical protein
MTPEERIVWEQLRANRLGVHFRRQQPLAPCIVDFYCHQARLVVEIDGSPHRQQQGYDQLRDSYLARCGIRVLRLAKSFGPQLSELGDLRDPRRVGAPALTLALPLRGRATARSRSCPIPLTPFPKTGRGEQKQILPVQPLEDQRNVKTLERASLRPA